MLASVIQSSVLHFVMEFKKYNGEFYRSFLRGGESRLMRIIKIYVNSIFVDSRFIEILWVK
jgi:hypothetical protein